MSKVNAHRGGAGAPTACFHRDNAPCWGLPPAPLADGGNDGTQARFRRVTASSCASAAARASASVIRASSASASDAAFRPFDTSGPLVRGAPDDAFRRRYYARIAEEAKPKEKKDQLADQQRKAFNRALKSALDAKTLCARERKGERYVWLHKPQRTVRTERDMAGDCHVNLAPAERESKGSALVQAAVAARQF